MSCAPDWLQRQFNLCEEHHVGELIQYHYPDTGGNMNTILEIVEIAPPAPVSRGKTAQRCAWHNWGVLQLGGLVIEGVTLTHWRQAMARTRSGKHEDPPRAGATA